MSGFNFPATSPSGSGGGGGGGDAADITYTPTTSADWDVAPDDVEEALDSLAGRVNINEEALANAVALYTLTATTESLDPSGGSDEVDFVIPGSATHCVIMGVRITRTAGASTSVGFDVYTDDLRSGDQKVTLIGSPFGFGATIGADPIYGPRVTGGGFGDNRATVSYPNIDDASIIHGTVTNYDAGASGTFQIDLIIMPMTYA